ncbi:MAG: agmatinase family protein [bacterium]|jgi:agmatinase
MIADLSRFDPNGVSVANNNIFGLPFNEENAELIIIPVPWEVTVSYKSGTARSPEQILKASLQVDLYDSQFQNSWKKGVYMKQVDKKILLKNDYLRKENELYLNFINTGEKVETNKFMSKTLKEVNEGCSIMTEWVYNQCMEQLNNGRKVGLLGGDHSTAYGFIKALSEKHGEFGILQIDAHCDLRKSYEGLENSHGSIMYNVLNDFPQVTKLVQLGIRDYCEAEWNYICDSNYRVITYFEKEIRERQFEGQTWQHITDEIIDHLPQKVYISYDIDGLDPKLCPHTGTPVPGGFEMEQLSYLFKKIRNTGREIIGFDLSETGTSNDGWDENVGARVLFKLCNLMLSQQPA